MSPEEVLNRTVLDCIAEIDMEDIEDVVGADPRTTSRTGFGVVAV